MKVFLQDDLNLATVTYESEPRTGESIAPILEKILDQATFAVLVLTAEDETVDGACRARQNVVHEAGLFQGRLGFKKAILLVQDGVEEFSNVAGLQHISFSGDRIEQAFYEVQRVLKREGQIVQ
jgi:predicted nucleotide-binding protein